MKRIAVLGGGVSGVVLARRLADNTDTQVDLIERDDRLGGLQRSVSIDGLVFDIGAFLFIAEHGLLRTFPFLYDRFVEVHPKVVSVTPGGGVCRYPLTARRYMHENGVTGLLAAAAEIPVSRLRYRRRDSVPAYAKYFMGDRIYRRSGLQNYIERLFGVKDEELDVEFALQRMASLRYYTPERMLRRAAHGLMGRVLPLKSVPNLVRPPEGFGSMYQDVGECLAERGVSVRLGCSVKSVSRAEKGGFELKIGDRTEWFSHVISTIPMPTMLRLIGETPGTSAEHVSLVSLFYRGSLATDASHICNFTLDGCWKRITAFSRLYGKAEGQDHFVVEITTRDASPTGIEALGQDFEAHAEGLGLFGPGVRPQLLGSHVTERAYPLFRKGMITGLEDQRNRLTAAGIQLLGRQGSFAYLSSFDAAQRAIDLAESLS